MHPYHILRKLLFCLNPEAAHQLAHRALKAGLVVQREIRPHPRESMLFQDIFGRPFVHPVGLAAGFDKDAELIPALFSCGFGFVEVGTATPQPQSGNPQPRLFRLTADRAIINRMGFNNKGAEHFIHNIDAYHGNGIIGANIGKNKATEDPIVDYLTMLEHVYGHADYITVNISSPNTQGLRKLQGSAQLDELLSALREKEAALLQSGRARTPLLVKLAPDLTQAELEAIAATALKYQLSGLIMGNTTIGLRETLKTRKYAEETGGLSGAPLFELSTQKLALLARATGGKIPLIGAGGIFSAEDAYRKICAGASLVQLYSALIYEGFGLIGRIKHGIIDCLTRDGHSHISEAVGKDFRN